MREAATARARFLPPHGTPSTAAPRTKFPNGARRRDASGPRMTSPRSTNFTRNILPVRPSEETLYIMFPTKSFSLRLPNSAGPAVRHRVALLAESVRVAASCWGLSVPLWTMPVLALETDGLPDARGTSSNVPASVVVGALIPQPLTAHILRAARLPLSDAHAASRTPFGRSSKGPVAQDTVASTRLASAPESASTRGVAVPSTSVPGRPSVIGVRTASVSNRPPAVVAPVTGAEDSVFRTL